MGAQKATKKRKTKALSPIEVSLMRAAAQAKAFLAGDANAARITYITARLATAAVAPEVTPKGVRQLRVSLGLSQPVFAEALNVSPETVKGWEQGKKYPSGPAKRLLQIAAAHPSWITELVRGRLE